MYVSEGEKMKTNEFIKKVKELGYEIKRSGYNIEIMFNDFIVAGVYTDQMHVMTFYSHEKLLLRNADKLFHLLVEYAKTPVEDREEEKKFYLRHRWMTTLGGFPKGLRINIVTGTADVEQMIPLVRYKNQFTKKEIEEIKEKFNTDLADFEMIEVEE